MVCTDGNTRAFRIIEILFKFFVFQIVSFTSFNICKLNPIGTNLLPIYIALMSGDIDAANFIREDFRKVARIMQENRHSN